MIYTARFLMMALVEAICFMLFMGTFFEVRSKSKNRSYVIGTIVLFAFGTVVSSIEIIFLRMIVVISFWIIFSCLFYNSNLLWKVLFSVLNYGVLLISDGIVQLIVITDKSIILNSNDIKYTIILMLAKLIQVLIVLMVRLLLRKRLIGEKISYKYMMIFLIVPIMTVISMLVFLMMEEHMAMAVGTLILLGLNVVFILMMNIITDKERRLAELKLMEENALKQLSLHAELEHAYGEQRKSTHEFRHHIDCLCGLLKNGEYVHAKEYVGKLNDDFMKAVNMLNTGNPIVDSVLNQKIISARNKGIKVIPVFNDLSQLRIEKDDIVVILSNLLENAIEACERLKKEKKEIKLYIEDYAEGTTLVMKNPLEKEIKINNGKLITSKDDKLNHGIGMSNVKNIVEKYDGECMISTKDNIFSYTIHIEY